MLKRNLFWIITAIITYIFIFLIFYISPSLSVKYAALIGVIYLGLTLIPINSIRWISPRFPFIFNTFRWIITHRRDFGINAGLAFLAHADLSWFVHGNLSLSFLFTPPIIFGTIAYVIFLLILVSSNTYAINKLRTNWKRLQSLVWVTIPFVLIHSIIASTIYQGELTKIGVIGFGGLIIFAVFETMLIIVNPETRKTNNWKHIRLILIGNILALILFIVYPK